MYKKLAGMTGTADTRSRGSSEDITTRRGGDADQYADDPPGSQ
jgi:hypothetical protein